MKVLVVGGGGREHALCWKISQSPLVERTYCAPGNAGISRHAECLDIGVGDFDSLAQFVKKESVDLTVVGPEQPLCKGITDFFEREGLLIFGPSKAAAELEGSKIFSKNLMKKYGIPTGEYFVFTDMEQAIAKAGETEPPFVVKADGLAAGKGVIICHSHKEGEDAVRSMMERGAFGEAGAKVVIEEFLTGEEASFFAFTDGENILPLEPSQDHKPIFDGDKGPNTGGMGAYIPAPVVDNRLRQRIIDEVMIPTVQAMKSEGRTYRGILYAGLMIKENNLKVLEFNCRFGDPEAQPLLMKMESDIVPILYSIAQGEINTDPIKWKDGFSVCVVMASRGYPGNYDKGVELKKLKDFKDTNETVIFHAGTAFSGDKLVTSSGRVLGVTSLGSTIEESIQSAYKTVNFISDENLVYRTDIGKKALLRTANQKKLNQKIQKILDKCSKGKYIFRGEKECYDKVSSNLYRYYSELYKARGQPLDNNFPVSKLEKGIVDRAKRHIRLDAPNIEVLTQLQHHGGKTTLIDFTKNIYVALFFACNGSFDKDGRIVLLSTSGIPEQTDIDYEKGNEYTIVRPTSKNPRVVFQNSIFLHVTKGFMETSKYEIFKVEKDLKKEFLDYLRQYCGIESESIYNDIQGFIENQENYPDAEAEFYMGVMCHDEDLFGKAVAHYNEAIRLNPQFAEAYFNRAVAKADLKEVEEAIRDYDQAIELRPEFVKAYVNRGNMKTQLGKFEEAVEDLDQALKLSSEHVEAYTNRGYTKTLLGRMEEAIEDYNQAIELKPDNETYTNRGSAKVALGYLEEAIRDFDKAIELSPIDARAYYNRGLAKLAMGYPEEAIRDFDKAIELNPKHVETYINRGSMKAVLGNHKEAIRDFDKAIELNPLHAGAYFNRGNAKARLNHLEEAVKDFDKAVELNPLFAEAYYSRGKVRTHLGHMEESRKDFDKAKKLNPEKYS